MKNCAITPPDWLARAAVYQINPRTFSKEGTIKAIEKELPFLKELGFSIMYLCPIFQADVSTNLENWSERQKKSQTNNPKNPYRMKDYFTIDEEYGTMDDLRDFVAAAHALDIRVILDLVYAHIGPDADILKRRPDFAKQNADGSTIYSAWHFPFLDFNCPGLREYLYANMVYFVGALDVDGFRCDVGDAVPLDFWAEGKKRICAVKPDAILINEGKKGESLRAAFDSMYCFDWHSSVYNVFTGDTPASDMQNTWETVAADLPDGSLLLRDIDNHDTVTDWPARTETAAGHEGMEQIEIITYLMDGIPMVYCGNELGDETVMSLFANRFFPGRFSATDRSIAKEDYSLRRQALMKKLNELKKKSDILRYGKTHFLTHSKPDQVFSFAREWEGKQMIFIGNCKNESVQVTLDTPLTGEILFQNRCRRQGNQLSFEPYGYLVLKDEEE